MLNVNGSMAMQDPTSDSRHQHQIECNCNLKLLLSSNYRQASPSWVGPCAEPSGLGGSCGTAPSCRQDAVLPPAPVPAPAPFNEAGSFRCHRALSPLKGRDTGRRGYGLPDGVEAPGPTSSEPPSSDEGSRAGALEECCMPAGLVAPPSSESAVCPPCEGPVHGTQPHTATSEDRGHAASRAAPHAAQPLSKHGCTRRHSNQVPLGELTELKF